MCEAVADLSIVTVLEVIGKKFVNDDNDSGVDKETVCGVQQRDLNGKIRITNAAA